jgi:hypothetical protein
MLTSKPELLKLAVEIAGEYDLDAALICAHIDVRSRWDAGFCVPSAVSYLVHQNFPDPLEAEHRAIQWGLMGIQGQFAREYYTDPLPELLHPDRNLQVGCSLFRRLMHSTDPALAAVEALTGWNRESNREAAARTLLVLASYRELLARIDEAPHTFQHDDTILLPERLQIEGNPLLEVGSTSRTRSLP